MNKGGSMSVVIPPKLAKEIGIKGGDYVKMDVTTGKTLVLSKLIISK